MDSATLRAELARLHRESYGWALNCCGHDPEEAEEVLQTSYLKVLAGSAHFGGQSQFKTWLFAVIRITAANERRLRFFRRFRLLRYEQRAEMRPAVERPDTAASRSELHVQLRQALARMPQRQRQVLHLVFYHDLSLSEVASVLGISIGSARTHYERGKQTLREWLYESKICEKSGCRREAIQTALS